MRNWQKYSLLALSMLLLLAGTYPAYQPALLLNEVGHQSEGEQDHEPQKDGCQDYHDPVVSEFIPLSVTILAWLPQFSHQIEQPLAVNFFKGQRNQDKAFNIIFYLLFRRIVPPNAP